MSDIIITSNAKTVKAEIDKRARRALKIIGIKAESYAKALSPVDTGLLRNSITFAVGGELPNIAGYTDNSGQAIGEYGQAAPQDSDGELTLIVGTNVHYAVYNELGHMTVNGGYVEPRPFLRPAMENHVDEYKKILEKELAK